MQYFLVVLRQLGIATGQDYRNRGRSLFAASASCTPVKPGIA
jgi:hypothetical protein